MAAPTLTPLGAPPTRANPNDFPARADAFLGALPTLVSQINALVAYWNLNLDTSAFINRNVASTVEATLTFALPPVVRASATAGEQTALTLSKGATQRQAIRVRDDGSVNISPLNGAQAVLRVGGNVVYHEGNLPSAGDVGALPDSGAAILSRLATVDGSLSGLDADLLDGQEGAFYRNASNLNAGTVPDARLPTNLVRSTIAITAGDGLTGGGTLAAGRSLAVDGTVARRNAPNTFVGSQAVVGQFNVRAPTPTSNPELWLRKNDEVRQGGLYSPLTSPRTIIRAYSLDGSTFKEAYLDEALARFVAPAFGGDGNALSNLNASALGTGSVPDARIPSSIVRSSVGINAGDGLSGGGTLAATRTLSVDSTVVRTSRSVTAGLGLTGGGTLGSDREIALGTPSSITADSTNSRTPTSHTHALSSEAVGELMARVGTQSVGTFSMMRLITTSGANPGTNVAGSNLRFSNIAGIVSSTVPSGTYRCMGYIPEGSNNGSVTTTLWKKVA